MILFVKMITLDEIAFKLDPGIFPWEGNSFYGPSKPREIVSKEATDYIFEVAKTNPEDLQGYLKKCVYGLTKLANEATQKNTLLYKLKRFFKKDNYSAKREVKVLRGLKSSYEDMLWRAIRIQFVDIINNSRQMPENKIFTKHYSKLKESVEQIWNFGDLVTLLTLKKNDFSRRTLLREIDPALELY